MKYCRLFCVSILIWLLYSCNNRKNVEQLDPTLTESFLAKQAIGYWDLNYKFPTSYIQVRDTQAWFFSQCMEIDSILMRHASEILYTDQDTALLITFHGDTLAQVNLPCSCDWTDDIPYGPRAFDSLNNMILDDFIQVDENGYLDHITYDLVYDLYPAIRKKMNMMGYVQVHDKKKMYPQYLLIEYIPESDSIQLVKACAKYACFFYDDYVNILRNVLLDYCKDNNVSRLLTGVEIFIPASKDSFPVEKH